MQYFDLHCDTLYKAIMQSCDINNEAFEVSVSKTDCFKKWCQCMAIWIPDNISATEGMQLFLDASQKLLDNSQKFNLMPFDRENNESNMNYIFTLENASILNGDINNINLLLKHNVKMVTLTWNDENCIGGGADLQGKGLTEFGKLCVKKLEDNDIVIDVSHASDKTFYDVLEHTTKPLVASHSNARYICSHRRNLTDDQFLHIALRKGIVGLNFHKDFLNIDRSRAKLFDVLKHTEHFLSLGGEDILCIGSDFDGADPVSELSSIEKTPILYESYLKIGYNEQLVQKIMYYNAYNFFSRF